MLKPGSKSQVRITAEKLQKISPKTDFIMLVPVEKKKFLLAVLTYIKKTLTTKLLYLPLCALQ